MRAWWRSSGAQTATAWVIGALSVLTVALSLPSPGAAQPSWLARTRLAELRSELQSSSLVLRERAARRLATEGSDAGARRVLLDALTLERSSRVRVAIARALSWRAHPSIAMGLIEALDASGGADARDLALALATVDTPASRIALVDALGRDDLQAAAHEALLVLGPSVAPTLAGRLREDPTHIPAIALLGAMRDVGSVPLLDRLAASPAVPVRRAALTALAAIGDVRARPTFLAHVDDPDASIALVATDALLGLATAADVPRLETWLPDAVDVRRRRVLEALLHADATRAAAILAAEVGSADPDRVLIAGGVAIDHPQVALLPVLYGLYEEGTRRAEAASALAEVDGGAGIGVLLRETVQAEDGSEHARRGLAVALRRWGERLSVRVRRQSIAALQAGALDGPAAAQTVTLRALARDRSVLPRIRENLAADDPSARGWAAQAAGLLGDEDVVDTLVEALVEEADPSAFRQMALALSTLPTSATSAHAHRLWAAALPAFADPSRVAEVALLAASLELDARDRRRRGVLLRRLLRHASERVRSSAAWALGRAGETSAWRALLDRVDVDDSLTVRRAAARALAVLRSGVVQHTVDATAEGSESGTAARLAPFADDDPNAEWVTETIDRRGRGERDDTVRGFIRRAGRGIHTPAVLGGAEVLRLRVVSAAAAGGVEIEVQHADGRWVRTQTLPTGEYFLADLPSQTLDVRVVVQ